jgi:imidazolonepropionase-like amidohydrolase
MKYLVCFSLVFLCGYNSISQYIPQNGVKESQSDVTVITNAHIYVSSSLEYERACMIIQHGQVVKIGKKLKIPKGAIVIDMKGRTILPAFIELNSSIGIPEEKKKEARSFSPQMESSKTDSYYWNEAIHPEINSSELYQKNLKELKLLNEKGFGFVVSHNSDGIARGSGVLVSAHGEELSKDILIPEVASFYSLNKGSSRQTYPSSQMGSIALLRQSLYDYRYYLESERCFTDLSMESWEKQMELTKFMETKDKWEILRAARIGKEFGFDFIYFGSGNEYECANSLKDLDAKIILPINFPKAFDVSDPYISRLIPLSQLKHWELAPYNFSILSNNEMTLAISSMGIKSAAEFWNNIRTIMQTGIPKNKLLKSLTETPASFLGQESKMGSLEKNKLACFSVFSSDPFVDKEAKVNEMWLMGQRKKIAPYQSISVLGSYNVSLGNSELFLDVSGRDKRLSAFVYEYGANQKKVDSTKKKVDLKIDGNDITLTMNREDSLGPYSEVMHGKVSNNGGVMEGDMVLKNGLWSKWNAIRIEELDSKEKDNKSDSIHAGKCWFPNLAYGLDSCVTQHPILIRNATVWTNEKEGILLKTDVLLENGKISEIGESLKSNISNIKEIDAAGMHLTSGIIDEHSHIAISKGVNESGQAVSAEVSIGDVVNPDDINIYRQLSGGVTCSQLLHGSANPIGGQSAIVKLKWGATPKEMLLDDAPGFIKFALGENVKQSNWGNFNTIRFPQTRMGVEQLFYDGFHRAKKYKIEWDTYRKNENKKDVKAPRIDLELEALLEIIESKRFITCHSYVQSEVNMLMHVADSIGFKVNTFTHILEGYKVADKMREHGVGGSTFSDWWAYKYEVNDAIPYNASLMHDNGVVVAINSDDAEMGRRLNQEAAKGVKYGGMSQEAAWKMVTLNPAKLLHLDHQMGSIKIGKDADLVLWSDNPLSIKAKVDKTIIEGAIYYDASQKAALERRNRLERARIIQKMLLEKETGKPLAKFKYKKERFFHCDSVGEEGDLKTNLH